MEIVWFFTGNGVSKFTHCRIVNFEAVQLLADAFQVTNAR